MAHSCILPLFASPTVSSLFLFSPVPGASEERRKQKSTQDLKTKKGIIHLVEKDVSLLLNKKQKLRMTVRKCSAEKIAVQGKGRQAWVYARVQS